MSKISIRFYKDHKVRAVWDEEKSQWWFSILDIVGAINEQGDHEKNRNYWKYLKAKLRKEQSEVVSDTTQLKLTASDGKRYNTDVISQAGVEELAKAIRNSQAMTFLDWFKYSENTIDGQSKKKLTIRLVLLILCAFSINTAFAQDVRQKPVVKKQTTTTTKQKSTKKPTSTKKQPTSSKKGSTKAPAPTIGTEEDRNNPIEYMSISVGGISFRMVKVDGGTFMMGATLEQGSDVLDDEKPAHSVTLSTYYIGETEVTQELWQEVMGSNPSKFKGSRRPVEQVSWDDCKDFIRRLNQRTGKNFRLPTEAEWEYAARGGRKSYGYKYAGGSSVGDVAWYHDNSGNTTFPVAQKRANELGLYDMSGNVREWCQDYYDAYPSSSQTNPTGPSSELYRVNRGGSWYVLDRYNRVSFRGTNEPSLRDNDLGLRLAL